MLKSKIVEARLFLLYFHWVLNNIEQASLQVFQPLDLGPKQCDLQHAPIHRCFETDPQHHHEYWKGAFCVITKSSQDLYPVRSGFRNFRGGLVLERQDTFA